MTGRKLYQTKMSNSWDWLDYSRHYITPKKSHSRIRKSWSKNIRTKLKRELKNETNKT